MLITIDFLVLLVLIILALGSLGFAIFFILSIKQQIPDIFKIWNAAKNGTGLVRYHHANGIYSYETPKFEGNGKSGHFEVKGGYIKFTDMSGTKTERLFGKIPVQAYMDNLPVPVSSLLASWLDDLADIFAERGYSIQGIDQIFYHVLRETFKKQPLKTRPDAKWKDLQLEEQVTEMLSRLEPVLDEIGVNDEVTRGKMRAIIPYIMRNREQIEQAMNHIEPHPFSFQAIIRTLDDYIAFTSASVYNMKMVVEADAKNGRSMKDMMPVIVVGFLVFIIIIAFAMVAKG